ncbi:B37 [Murid betaherpesvirus 8]|nr:E37 [Murid betaherpesvirus 8]AFX83358.1 E37 [Murid betaherpesvirus 8]AKB93238.1 B37 [Murid betaherpesvirus 8]WPH24953.1 B37 [Murid betaherpesvirus 8]WPH25087.1 B37 [Murid betaherpesvirus 8]
MCYRNRCCVIYLMLLQASMSSNVPEKLTFECSYDVCLVHRKDGRVNIGCVVTCTYGLDVVFSGRCNEGFNLVSNWFVKIHRRLEVRNLQILKIGIAYYFAGYVLRPLSLWPDLITHSHGKTSMGGVARCWVRGAESGGSVELKTHTQGAYKLDVEPGLRNITWTAEDTNHANMLEFLQSNLSEDVYIFNSCPKMLYAVSIGHHSDGSPDLMKRTAIIRRDACAGGFVSDRWADIWKNWTKYCEFYEDTQRDPAFSITIKNSKLNNGTPNLIGMFVVVFGAFAMLALFCAMTIKQRKSIFKDFRGESSLRIKDGGVVREDAL